MLRDLKNPLATPPPIQPGPAAGTVVAIDRVVGGARAAVTRRIGAAATAPRVTVTINGFDQVAQVPRVIEPAPGINVYLGAEVGWRALR